MITQYKYFVAVMLNNIWNIVSYCSLERFVRCLTHCLLHALLWEVYHMLAHIVSNNARLSVTLR